MTEIKRIISLILICTALLSLFSCGQSNLPSIGSGSNNSGGAGADNELDDDPTNDFTVQLTMDGQPFIPATAVHVYWNDGYNVHSAQVDESGRAVVDGLDGDYQVTLSSVPSGFAYNPNAYIATNDNRNIVIEMRRLNILHGSGDGVGKDVNKPHEITDPGIYTVTVNSEDDFNYIRFAPKENGVYTVESWVSITEEEINPVCLAYLGSSHYVYGEYRVTDVGLCGNYTRNFIHTVKIADENISSSGGGQVTFAFAIGAETKSGVYPVNVTVAVKLNGGYEYDRGKSEIMIPTHDWSAFDFNAFKELAGGKLVNPETVYPGTTDSYVFDDDFYKLWPVSEGGDGVYHVYDEDKYPETGGYGPILVAYITSAFRFSPIEVVQGSDEQIALSFVDVDDRSGELLVGQYNYRAFIRGYESLAAAGFYCVKDCLCHLDGSVRACPPGCTKCKVDCSPCSIEEMNIVGYAELVNADGVVPVTEELKIFLQRYVVDARYYFADGEGSIEISAQNPIDAYEDSQWLYACGYYAENE
ncbi:MAG: hypothetical protein J6V80_05360 [Clostridia bacterium]|nr:hypothetical protein [Clostridia bacterium]